MKRALLIVAAAACLPLAGCFDPPKIKSPYTSLPATEGEIQIQAQAEAKRMEAEAISDAEGAKAKLEDAKREHDLEALRLGNATEEATQELLNRYEGQVSSTLAELQRIRGKAEAGRALIAQKELQAQQAFEAIAMQRDFLSQALGTVVGNPAVQGLAGSVPGGSAALTLLMGGVGAWALRGRQHKAADSAYDEGKAIADAEARKRDDTYDAAQAAAQTNALLAALVTKFTPPEQPKV